MKVKVGDTWFEAGPGKPVMVKLGKADMWNIIHMCPENDRYAVFSEDERMTVTERQDWMNEGNERAA